MKKVSSVFVGMLLITTILFSMTVVGGEVSIDANNEENIKPQNNDVVSTPLDPGDVIFEQLVSSSSGDWSFGNSDAGEGYEMIDNFWGINVNIGKINWTGLTIHHDGVQWVDGDPTDMEFNIRFYSDNPNNQTNHPSQIFMEFTNITPDSYSLTGDTYSGFDAYYFEYTFPVDFTLNEGWISIQSTAYDSSDDWLLWGNSPTGDSFSWQVGATPPDDVNDFDLAFTLYEGAPSEIDVPFTSLSDDWNLFSIPTNQTYNLSDIVVQVGLTNYSWSDAVSNTIVDGNVYVWDRVSQGYDFVSILEPGDGYWIYVYEPCILWINSIPVESDNMITSVEEDWNLVGMPGLNSVNFTDVMITYGTTDYTWADAVSNTIIDGNVYAWDRDSQGYIFADAFETGDSGWLYAYDSCDLWHTMS